MPKLEDQKKQIEIAKEAHSHRNNSRSGNTETAASIEMREYKETTLLFIKMLVLIFLCETAIMVLLNIIPLSKGWEIIADSVLLTALGTMILYWLFVRPFRLSLQQRNYAIDALQISEKNLAESQKIANLGSWELNLLTNEEIWSDQTYRLLGFEPGQVSPSYETFLSTVHPDDREKVTAVIKKAISENKSFDEEFRIIRKDGTERIMYSRGKINFDESGKPAGLVGTAQDITERKKAERDLMLARKSIDDSGEGIFWVDKDARFVNANLAGCRKLGYTKEELLSMTVHDIDPNFPKERWPAHWQELRQKGSIAFETLHRHKSGNIFPVEVRLNNIKFEDKEYNFAFVKDISERKKMEDKLRFLSYITEQVADSVITTDLDFKITWVNKAFQNLYGYSPEEILGRIPDFPNVETDSEQIQNDIYETVHSGKVWRGELLNQKKDGSIFPCELMIFPLLDEQGKIFAYAGHQRDITERKKAKEALEKSEHRYRTLVETNPYGIQEIDTSGVITYTNPAYQKMLGYNEQELLGKSIFDLLEPQSRKDELREYLSVIVKEQPLPTTYYQKNRTKDDRIIDMAVDWNYNRDNEGHVVGFTSVITDITDRNKAEKKLLSQNELLNSISKAQSMYITIDNPQPVFDMLLETLVSMTESEYGFLDEVCRDSNGQLFKKSLSLSNISWDDESRNLYEQLRNSNMEFRNLNNLAGAPAITSNLIITNNPKNDPRAGGLPKGHPPIHSYMGVPMFFGGELVGVAGIANRPGGYNEEIASFLNAFFSTCAGIIHAIRKERKEQQFAEELRLSEQKFRELAETIDDVFWITSLGDLEKIEYVSGAFRKIWAREPQELYTNSRLWIESIHHEDRKNVVEQFEGFIRGDNEFDVEYRIVREDGSIRWICDRGFRIINQTNQATRIMGLAQDITERKQVEKRLQQESLVRSTLLDNIPCIALILKKQTREIIACNENARKIGADVGKTCYETCAKRDKPCPFCRAPEVWATNEYRRTEAEYQGTYYDGIWVPLTEDSYVHYIFDISERKLAEQKILDDQAQLKSLASQLSLTEERERHRLATELHDQIGQSLVFSKIKLDQLRESTSSYEITKALDEVSNCLRKVIGDTRTLTFELSSPILHELGFEAAVAEWLTHQIREKHGIEIEFNDDEQQKPLDDDIRAILFRNVRELLVNVIKHAYANKVKISIQRINEHINVDIEDDGAGFDYVKIASKAAEETKFGLLSIRQRLEQLGGQFEIDSKPGSGTKVTMTAPLKLT